IDPVLSYSTYLGSALEDAARAVASDLVGNLYVAGYTHSDVLVAKYDPAGALVYSTYLANTTYPVLDEALGLAGAAAAPAYITGDTEWAPTPTFPVTTGAYDTTHNGGKDAFLARLSTAGNVLIFSTFLGGSGDDYGRGVALTPDGYAVVVGSTASSGFPTTG